MSGKVRAWEEALAKKAGKTFFSPREAANALGVNPRRIRRWYQQNPDCPPPTKVVQMGKLTVRMWNVKDLERLRLWAKQDPKRGGYIADDPIRAKSAKERKDAA